MYALTIKIYKEILKKFLTISSLISAFPMIIFSYTKNKSNLLYMSQEISRFHPYPWLSPTSSDLQKIPPVLCSISTRCSVSLQDILHVPEANTWGKLALLLFIARFKVL